MRILKLALEVIKNLRIISSCRSCHHWEIDLGYCKAREEINWAGDDGCKRWKCK